MNTEPVWMEEIRQQVKNNRFYVHTDKEREQYKTVYLKTLETLDEATALIIRQYVELLQKCEYHHIRAAYISGMEDEKANQKARKEEYYQLITQENALKTAVVLRTSYLLQLCPAFAEQQEAFKELRTRYYELLRTLPEEDRNLARAYQKGMADMYEIMFHIAAGFSRGII